MRWRTPRLWFLLNCVYFLALFNLFPAFFYFFCYVLSLFCLYSAFITLSTFYVLFYPFSAFITLLFFSIPSSLPFLLIPLFNVYFSSLSFFYSFSLLLFLSLLLSLLSLYIPFILCPYSFYPCFILL